MSACTTSGAATAPKRVAELRELTRQRWAIAGEAAFLLDPNIRIRAAACATRRVHALAVAQLVDFPVGAQAYARYCSTSG